MPTLYDAIVAAGIPHEHHESDLYVPRTEAALKLVKASGLRYASFRDAIDGQPWLDIPFAYEPFWEAARARGTR